MPSGEKKISGPELLDRLNAACRGLVFVSETDSPISPVFSTDSSSTFEEFAKGQATDRSGPTRTGDAGDFFHNLTQDRDWHSEREKQRTWRFRQLEHAILRNLTDVKLIRIGRISIDVFVLGRDSEGNIAGIRTRSVET